MKNMKFKIRDAAQFAALQDILLELGYYWPNWSICPENVSGMFLYTYESGVVNLDNAACWFDAHENKYASADLFIATHKESKGA